MKAENIERFLQMLQPTRLRNSSVQKDETDGRTPFDSDFSRVALSAAVRRLQDKTQVFPLADFDFVRNRLTHSLEVMTMARGLGLGVEKMLIKEGVDLINRNIDDPMRNAISKILEVASLVHDLGNPPFGHKGEKSVQKYFRKTQGFVAQNVQSDLLNDIERKDLQNIEGNVQGFRILCHLALADDDYSYNLTCPVLSTIIKYPFSSVDGNKKTDNPFTKKFGFLQSEVERYNLICHKLGLYMGQRHPLTYLLEAADDITYNACDLEDGFRNGAISIQEIKNHLTPENVGNNEKIIEYVNELKEENSTLHNELFMQKLRIAIQSEMIIACTKEFIANIDSIIEGTYKKSLIEATHYCNLCESLGKLDICNFNSTDVKSKEDEGINKMIYLLDGYSKAMILLHEGSDTFSPEFQLYQTISPNYRKVACKAIHKVPMTLYEKLLLVTDYMFGMTDSFVIKMYENEEIKELILRVKSKIDNLK